MRKDVRILVKRLNEIGVTDLQATMAATILACNGLEAALRYADGLSARRDAIISETKQEAK